MMNDELKQNAFSQFIIHHSSFIVSYRVNLGGEDEVAFAEAVNGVRVESHFEASPAEADVGVMTFRFGHLADAVDERERLAKVRERIVLLQVMLADDFPAL
jgi:hypothetical protein